MFLVYLRLSRLMLYVLEFKLDFVHVLAYRNKSLPISSCCIVSCGQGYIYTYDLGGSIYPIREYLPSSYANY